MSDMTLFSGETHCFYGCGHVTYDRLENGGRSPSMERHYIADHQEDQ